MKKSWFAVAAAVGMVASLASGCGGPLGQEAQAPLDIQWSSSKNQCLADKTPIFLDGISSQSGCSALRKSADEGTMQFRGSGGATAAGLCCAEVCTVTPGGMECSGTVCVRCALPI